MVDGSGRGGFVRHRGSLSAAHWAEEVNYDDRLSGGQHAKLRGLELKLFSGRNWLP